MIKFNQKGFTLIELLVTVSILGILASVVLANVGKYAGSGKNLALSLEFSKMVSAESAYIGDTGKLPADTKALVENNYIYTTPTLAEYKIDQTTGKIIQTPK
ncbi:MAG: type II secretion system protein [Dehalococcoidia bacterium]|jgi:type IV pilus assembly protein PilA|nr:type II secretion system protein [Dehalococcoidia bacterium]MDD5494063.1 type II secretion system protein [Dehalococcoidia bacterium]